MRTRFLPLLLFAMLLVVLCAPLAGCGQKGDLYLPDEPQTLQP